MRPDFAMGPRKPEAERALLGALMRYPEQVDAAIEVLDGNDFASVANQLLWGAIVHHHENRQPLDMAALANYLVERKALDDVGGYGYLAEVWNDAGTRVQHYVDVVLSASKSRQCLRICNELIRLGNDGAIPGQELVAMAEKFILNISNDNAEVGVEPLAKVVGRVSDKLDRYLSGEREKWTKSGLADLDSIWNGFIGHELTILAARPSVGKSALAMQLCWNAAIEGCHPIYFSLEMASDELVQRLWANTSMVPFGKIRRGELGDMDLAAMAKAREQMDVTPVDFDDASGQVMGRIAAKTRQFQRKHGTKLIVIDYIQLIQPEDRKQPREQQVADISRRCKVLARDLGISVLLVAQLNRESESSTPRRPILSDLRESGSLEQDADNVLFLWRQNPDDVVNRPPVSQINVTVAKQRNGSTGECTLAFRGECQRFENLAIRV